MILEDVKMKVDIVQANAEMCQEIAIVKRQVWESTYRGIYPNGKFDNYNIQNETQKFLKMVLSPNIHLYVAQVEGKIVAYMALGQSPRRNETLTNELVLLSVLKTHQGLGIGKQLFDFAKYHINQAGHDHFVLCCNKYNKGAQAFYLKMGCQVVSIDDDNEDKSIPQVNFVYHYW